MGNEEKIEALIWTVIAEINRQLPPEQRLEQGRDALLFGEGGGLDSLGMVNLIAGVEEKVQETFGRAINLADEEQLAGQESPFRTVGTLARYVASLL